MSTNTYCLDIQPIAPVDRVRALSTASETVPARQQDKAQQSFPAQRVTVSAAKTPSPEVPQVEAAETPSPEVPQVEAAETPSPEVPQVEDPPVNEATPAAPAPATGKAKLVEADDAGQPAIVRYKDASSGVARTVVVNEDGSQRAFGEDTIASLLAQEDEKVGEWMSSMSDRVLRGVVNEVSERFFELQDRVVKRQNELQEQSKTRSLAFFELPDSCTEKDLDNAYRRLARSMHPDKNGGTEEAKSRFQTMRAKYEELKDQFANGFMDRSPARSSAPPQTTGAKPPQEPSSEEPSPASQEQQAPQELPMEQNQLEAAPQPDGQPQEQNPATESPTSEAAGAGHGSVQAGQSSKEQTFYCRSREVQTLQTAAFKILQQMKMLQQNMQMLDREFEKLGKEDRTR